MASMIRNSESVKLDNVPLLSISEFRNEIIQSVHTGAHISALFHHEGSLFAVMSHEKQSQIQLISANVANHYEALTPECPQAHQFERELSEETGIKPDGHPWLKPVRTDYTDFFEVKGAEIHEVAVGPVHAGIIEPGHFRFQCHGEEVLHLEIALGYQHRGIETMLINTPDKRRKYVAETIAGDTSIGHATAYAQLLESLSGTYIPARALAIRGIALELERLANHTGDLGALANDVSYLPTASYCGRLRGEFLNMTALICGNRFGRDIIKSGGVEFDLEPDRIKELLQRLDRTVKDVKDATVLLWKSSSVMARFENVGAISREICLELGLVGPVARACGVERDIRHDFPYGIFNFVQIPVSTVHTGDVFARAYVRWLEIQRSADFVREQLEHIPQGSIMAETGKLAPKGICVSLVEGWRGEICHAGITNEQGELCRYKIVDPSFHNWFGLTMALRNQQISDFPLCNKSFNLSYCGHDL